MSAYQQVKVWEIDEIRPRPSAPSRPMRPSRLPRPSRIEPRDRRRPENTKERTERNRKLGVWARLCIVVTLGAAVPWWPYSSSCGFGLAAYVAATAMITGGGLWVCVCTWTGRMARTHALAMLVALWGVGLIAAEVLPRIGYAARSANWLCGEARR